MGAIFMYLHESGEFHCSRENVCWFLYLVPLHRAYISMNIWRHSCFHTEITDISKVNNTYFSLWSHPTLPPSISLFVTGFRNHLTWNEGKHLWQAFLSCLKSVTTSSLFPSCRWFTCFVSTGILRVSPAHIGHRQKLHPLAIVSIFLIGFAILNTLFWANIATSPQIMCLSGTDDLALGPVWGWISPHGQLNIRLQWTGVL